MSPVKIAGLEEHFVIPGLLAAWGKLPPDHRDLAFRPAADGGTGRRLLELGPERIAAMDATGLSVQVLSLTTPGVQSLPARRAVALAREANDLLAAAVTARPDRFQGLAALPTSAPGAAAEEFERALTGLGLDGAMLFGRTGPQHLDHAGLWPVYEVAERRGAPLHLHPQSPAPAVRNAYYSGFGPAVEAAFATFGVGWHYDAGVEFLRMVVAGVFDRFPRLQVVVGHGQDPDHGLRVRRHVDARRVAAGADSGQYLRRRVVHPGGHVLDGGIPAQHRRRAQGQHRRQGMPDPVRVPRVRDGREAVQQVPARCRGQRGGTGDQLPEGFFRGRRHGHATLNRQRGSR